MKKMNKIIRSGFDRLNRRTILTKICVLFLLFAFASCGEDSGLGPEVDLQAPVVTLTSHADNDTVPSEFTLTGTASDNEKVTSLTIDFDSQNLHYKVTPGGNWYKKTETSGDWVEIASNEASCVKKDDVWSWSVYVRGSEGVNDGTTYSLSAVVKDAIGNSGKNSKVDLSLLMDENIPDVSIYKPELLVGSYTDVKSTADSYNLRDGNVISRLFNGDITLTGRQSGSLSFKELLIEFDNGKLNAGTRKVTGDAEAQLSVEELAKTVSFDDDEFDSDGRRVYFSKTLKKANGDGDLRNWELSVPQSEWVTSDLNSDLLSLGEETGAGKVIRVVATSLSDSLAWERKVIGYFVWWPEADAPWIDAYIGNDDESESPYEIYPSANFAGTVQDDDGIKSLTYHLEKKAESEYVENVTETPVGISEEGAKYSAFAIRTPTENGEYRITLTVTDIYGKSSEKTKYFKTLDVSPPKIEFETPTNNGAVLEIENSDASGNITFKGTVSDDGDVKNFRMIYLHPEFTDIPENIIRYMGGEETTGWYKATENGTEDSYSYTDSDGNSTAYANMVYEIPLGTGVYDSEKQLTVYNFEKTFNIFEDLGIDGSEKTLQTQYFIFRAEDNGGTSIVQQFTLSGDTEQPKLTLDTLQLYKESALVKTETFENDNIPDLPVITNSHSIVLSGTCSDNSTDFWTDGSKFKEFKLEFGDAVATVNPDLKNHTWTATLKNLPKQSKTINVTLQDYGSNKAKVSKAVTIQTASATLEKIGCENNDGSYSANTTEKEIKITLEFSKNATFSGGTTPTLTLNNGGTATYTSGNGNAKHIFTYTVDSSSKSTEKLTVTEINANGNVWKDSAGTDINVEVPTENEKKLESRNIKIDNDAPYVASVKTLTSAGWYTKDAQILVMLEFNENVTVSGTPALSFVNGLSPASGSITATVSGLKNILFVYKVGENDGGDTYKTLSFASLTGSGVTVTDEANNTLSSWEPTTTSFADIKIDTKKPVAPTIVRDNVNWKKSDDIVTASAGASFTLAGEENGATVEYATDENHTNWKTYTGKVSFTANGTYYVWARQTDQAGNVSDLASSAEKVTIDAGDLLTKITADTFSGNYSLNTNTKEIVGVIKFRKEVTIPSGAKVTLNVKNVSVTSKEVDITGAGSAASEYKFTYAIVADDYTDGYLDVIGWSFSTVSVSGIDADMAFNTTNVPTSKRFTESRSIKIDTRKPTVSSVTWSGDNLVVTFDKAVTKVSGDITFTHDETSYRIPTVLSESEYNDMLNEFSSLGDYYTAGVNGASESLVNNTTTKYILNFDFDNTNSNLTTAFKTAKRHILTVPVVSSSVTTSGNSLTIALGSTYSLPVKGATYMLSIPASCVTDSFQNKNDADLKTVTAGGVESPVIRIKRDDYTINNAGNTKTAASILGSVTMPETAQMRFDCQTPDSKIYYNYEKKESDINYVKGVTAVETQTAKPSLPTLTASSPTATNDTKVTLGDTGKTFDELKGLKYAIIAKATKGTAEATSYEYATRTVLKFKIDVSGDNKSYDTKQGDVASDISENGTTLNMYELGVWVQGGDTASGTNSISTFPLSWGKETYKDGETTKTKFNYKLMKAYKNNQSKIWNGEWAWITWDLSAKAYHGFAAGDIPSDAQQNGPATCYAGECAWNALKGNYILYPGETLQMCLTDDTDVSDKGAYFFRKKNKLTR